jgi:hypothetical protein
MNLVERVAATQKTVDAFKGKMFDMEKGGDCIRLAVAHARHMGRKIKLPRYGDWESAAAALRKMGFSTLGEAMDAHFKRIQPHEIMAGDFVESLGSNGFSGLMVAVGNGRTLGFHEDIPHCDILQPLIISGAWRIV